MKCRINHPAASCRISENFPSLDGRGWRGGESAPLLRLRSGQA